MKNNLLRLLAACLLLSTCLASDNYVDLQGYADGASPRMKSTESGGIHTPVVSLASGTSIVPTSTALTDISGTITAGGSSQQISTAHSRKYLLVQNPSSATESLWVNFGAAATVGQPSIEIAAGTALVLSSFIPSQTITVIAATTGHAFTAKEAL